VFTRLPMTVTPAVLSADQGAVPTPPVGKVHDGVWDHRA
jgi:hypothetical protein